MWSCSRAKFEVDEGRVGSSKLYISTLQHKITFDSQSQCTNIPSVISSGHTGLPVISYIRLQMLKMTSHTGKMVHNVIMSVMILQHQKSIIIVL